MHRVTRHFYLVPVLLSLLAGCGGGHSNGNVAVIDLDKIATALGRDKLINQRLQTYTKEQEQALTKLRDEMRVKIDKQQKALAPNPSEEAKQKLAAQAQNMERNLRQEVNKAQQGSGQLRAKLANTFKGEVEPIARRIAALRGMDIVMVKQNFLLYVDPQADITDAVIDDMQQGAKKAPPAAEPEAKPAK